MRVLLTGATGLVGLYILGEYVARGTEIHAVTSRVGRTESISSKGVSWHVADLTRAGTAAALVHLVNPTHIVHCAWDTRHPTYWNSTDNLSWVSATAEMARAFAETGGRRFVMAGTAAEYDWSHGIMIEEVTPERPTTVYGWSKLAAKNVLQGAAHKLDFSAATGRVFFTFGPNENSKRYIPYICRMLAGGQTPRLSSGRQLRDLLHAHDTARAFVALADEPALTGAVNIGSGEPVTLGKVASLLSEIAGQPGETGIGSLADRADDPIVLIPTVSRLLSTGWRPRIELEVGLRETYAWWADRLSRDGGDAQCPLD